jgi:hypothetical protein
MSEIDTLTIILETGVFPDPIKVNFVFLEGGDLTGCILHGIKLTKNLHTYNPRSHSPRMPVNGAAARNPSDTPNRAYAMRLAMWRACCNMDGWFDYSNPKNGHDGWALGPVGRQIYSVFRKWQRDSEPELELPF